jgi:hypothetical protein
MRERDAARAGDVPAAPGVDRNERRRLGQPVRRAQRDAELRRERGLQRLGTVRATRPQIVERREVARGHRRAVHHVVEDRRDAVPRRDALVADPRRDAVGVDAIHDHAGAARLRHEQGGEREQIEDREREAVTLAELRSVLPARNGRRAGDEQVVLAVHHSLRPSRRAARVRDGRGRERVDRGAELARVLAVDERYPLAETPPIRQRVGDLVVHDRD